MSRWTLLLPLACVLVAQTFLSAAVGLVFARGVLHAAELNPPGLIRGVMTDDVKVLQEVGANSCLLWGPPGKPEAWDRLTQAGQFIFLCGLGEPKKEFFDFEGKKRVQMRVPFCYSNDWGKWWVEQVAGAAAKHYPAICLTTTDECAWNNGHIAYLFGVRQPVGTKFYCDCDKCREAVGTLPEITASRFLSPSPLGGEGRVRDDARRYIRYRYQAVADTLKAALEQARKNDPAFLSFFCLNLREVMAQERYPYGIALDMLPQTDVLLATSFQTSVDRRGEETRFIPAMTVKHLLAGRPRLGAVPCLAATVYDYRQKFDWTEAYYWRKEVEDLLPTPALASIAKDLEPYTLRDDEVILPAISCIAHGARGVMFFGDEKREALKKLFTRMADLEKRLAGATVPGEVVVLCSRQSEDEWMLSHAPKAGSRADLSDAMMQDGCWAQPSDRIAWEYNKDAPHSQGFRSTSATMEALIRLGIPFRLHFVENLTPADLAQAKVVVVPFCTHIADASAAILKDFAARGKVIAFAHRGEFDETGKRRGKPAIDAGAVFFDGEASEALKDPAGRKKLAEAMGDLFDVHPTCDSESVERTWLKLPDGRVAVFLINWNEKEATVKLGLPGGDPVVTVDVPGRGTAVVFQAARQ
jgi:hypothetical protein